MNKKQQRLLVSRKLHFGTYSQEDISFILTGSRFGTVKNSKGEKLVYLSKPVFRTPTSIKPMNFLTVYREGFFRSKYICKPRRFTIPEHPSYIKIELFYSSEFLETDVWKVTDGTFTICGSTPEKAYEAFLNLKK